MSNPPNPTAATRVEPNDRIDRICYRLYHSYEPIERLIDANPWLLDSLELPIGKPIRIPEIRTDSATLPVRRRPQLSLKP